MPLPPGLSRMLPSWAHAWAWAQGWAREGWGASGKYLVLASRHTGVPVVVLAAAALVVSWRLARRATRMAVEFLVALTLVLAATKLGWIRW